MQQFHGKIKLEFETVTGIQIVTSKWPPGLGVDFKGGLETGVF
jgi:hypothetical protein